MIAGLPFAQELGATHDPLHVAEGLRLEIVQFIFRGLRVVGELVQNIRSVFLPASQRHRQLGPVADEPSGEHAFRIGHFSLHGDRVEWCSGTLNGRHVLVPRKVEIVVSPWKLFISR